MNIYAFFTKNYTITFRLAIFDVFLYGEQNGANATEINQNWWHQVFLFVCWDCMSESVPAQASNLGECIQCNYQSTWVCFSLCVLPYGSTGRVYNSYPLGHWICYAAGRPTLTVVAIRRQYDAQLRCHYLAVFRWLGLVLALIAAHFQTSWPQFGQSLVWQIYHK